MFKQIYLLLSLILSFTGIYGQSNCNFEAVFPLPHNSSKMEGIGVLHNHKFIQSHPQANESMSYANRWQKSNSIENDSVYLSSRIYKYNDFPCFKIDKGTLHYIYEDDKLISNYYYLKFDSSKYGEAIDAYNKLSQIFTGKFPHHDQQPIYNDYYKEKTGKQTTFWRYQNKKSKTKENLSIIFLIKYQRDYETNTRTSQIDHYSIEVYFDNFSDSKLDMGSFSWPY